MFTAQVTGYLTRDPEVRNAGDRDVVATIRIGVKENRKRDRDDEGAFIDIEVWNDQADNAEKYLRKGDKIAAAGEMVLQRWKDNDSGDRREKWVLKGRIVEYPDRSESDRRDDRDDRGRDRDRRDDRGRGRDRDRGRSRDDRRDDRDDPGPREPQGGNDRGRNDDDLPF